jgi:hypothetical protein
MIVMENHFRIDQTLAEIFHSHGSLHITSIISFVMPTTEQWFGQQQSEYSGQ